MRFRRLSTEQGLSQSSIRAITQDRRGFMWFGTRDGLNRFDGLSVKVFRHEASNRSSIGDNLISSLSADRDSDSLWVGTRFAGLDLFDPKTRSFNHLDTKIVAPMTAQHQEIIELFSDSLNRLWIARADGGFLLHDPNLKKILPAPGWKQSSKTEIRSIAEVDSTLFLLGTNRGLFEYRPSKSSAVQITLNGDANPNLAKLAISSNGDIWIGLMNGEVIWVDKSYQFKRKIAPAKRDDGLKLINDEVRGISIDLAGFVWISSNFGLAKFDPNKQSLRRWRAENIGIDGLPSDRFSSSFVSREGNLWFGTSYAGAVWHTPNSDSFTEIQAAPYTKNGLPYSATSAVWQDADGTFWFGILDGGGLIHFDLHKGVLSRFVNDPMVSNSLSNDRIRSILRLENGELWVATVNGLNRLRSDGAGFDHFYHSNINPETIPSNRTEDLFEDSQGNLWVSTADAGIAKRCKNCDQFERYAIWGADEKNMNYLGASIGETRDGMIWICLSNGGMTRLNPTTGEIARLRHDPMDSSTIGFDTVAGMIEDSRGAMWVATHGGGISYSQHPLIGNVPKFISITRDNGLDSNVLTGVIEDVLGSIWISSASGLNRIDPESKQISRFGLNDGVFQGGYFVNAISRGPDGSLLFGSPLGVTLVTDPVPKIASTPAPPIISEILLGNESAFQTNRDSILIEAPEYSSRLTLPEKRAFFSIRLASLGFSRPNELRYAYRLDGASDQWNENARGDSLVSLSGLPSGLYRFEYQVAGRDSKWIKAERQLEIIIKPPLWRTNIAKISYLLAAFLCLIWFYRAWRSRQKEREQVAESDRLDRVRLSLALEASGAELWDMNPQSGELRRENPLTYRSVGVNFTLTNVADHTKDLHPDDFLPFKSAMIEHLRGNTERFELTFRARGEDGEYRWFLSRAKVIDRNQQNIATRLLGTTQDVTPLKDREEVLRLMNEGLERRVVDRTSELSRSNFELTLVIDELKRTQEQLVESEKMASLGGLVAGVAHEINTPLGVGVTAASHLQTEAQKISKKTETGRLTSAEVMKFAQMAGQSAEIIFRNLQRADKLVKSFKQIAVDQGSEEKRRIVLADYLDEIITSIRPVLKKADRKVEVSCASEIEFESYPGAIYQVMANLLMNAHIHAFEGRKDGVIKIEVRELDGAKIEIAVIDNGIGMEDAIRKRIFEPFFTTKRGRGGSGLGLHIVYNLVTQLLKGSIYCESEIGVGSIFRIILPRVK